MVPISEHQVTRAMRMSGCLTDAEVTSISVSATPFESIMSRIFELQLTYSEPGAGPERCLVKLVDPDSFQIGQAEVQFYQFAANSPDQPAALVTCYGALIDEEEQLAFVLLENRAAAAVRSEWPIPPSIPQCRRAIDGLAGIHAAYWGSELALQIRSHRTLPQSNVERLASCQSALFDRLGDALSAQRRSLVEALVEVYPALHGDRLAETGRQTIVHGDAHFWNFLIPEDDADPVALIDWQLWGVDLGTADLAYMIALHWFPERRLRFERHLVRGYTEALQQESVDYPAEQAWQDYRFCVAGLLNRVLIYSSVIPANIWWPHLERAFVAFEDLECRELVNL
jgi:Ser/Thr protein kinase RdoA (MazF antagonist)